MKKSATVILLFLCFLLAWNVFAYSGGMAFHVDGDEIDGPLGALLALLFAGSGTLLAGAIMLVVGAILAVVFAGVGILCLGGLGLGGLVMMLVLVLVIAMLAAPLLLPVLLVAAVWYLASRSRRNRAAV